MLNKIKSFFRKFKSKNFRYGAAAVVVAAAAYAWNAGYIGGAKYCSTALIKDGGCKRGDLLYLSSTFPAVKWCNFNRPVVTIPDGKTRDIKGEILCHYSGKKRTRRGD